MMRDRHRVIEGTGASPGVAIGRAYVWEKQVRRPEGPSLTTRDDVEAEITRFRRAVNRAIDDVESLLREGRDKFTDTERDLLEMQVEMLSDPQLHTNVVRQISEKHQRATDAVWEASDRIMGAFAELDSEYLRARAADVRGCAEHIVRHIESAPGLTAKLPAHSILVADDISTMEALALDWAQIAGMATRRGGNTSHATILARARNVPAVVACGDALAEVADGDTVVIDGSHGQVWRDPDTEDRADWERKAERWENDQRNAYVTSSYEAVTSDGRKIRLQANIGDTAEIPRALQLGAQGVGLYRTELLFMSRADFPSEEDQFESYKELALATGGLPVTIRTLDIGGDKPLSYFAMPREDNPFLGYRAIRMSLDHTGRFSQQLRAILRASAFGELRLMFPMICTMDELRRCKALVEEARSDLRIRGIDFNDRLPIGMMIETPAAALIADLLAKEVDFFSLGTNDLCQYTMAVDRGNEKVGSLYDPFHPAVLRLIAATINHAVDRRIDVSLCGEMAGDPLAAVLLAGMGLQSLSMTPSAIPAVKQQIIQVSYAHAQRLASEVLTMSDAREIRTYLRNEVLNKNT